MKILLLCFVLYWVIPLDANAQRSIFLRVYDESGKKISKGHFVAATDSFLQLNRDGKIIEIPVGNIETIRKRRSAGHSVAMGALAGLAGGGLLGYIDNDPGGFFTPEETGILGGSVGLITGAAAGAIIAPFKKTKKVLIGRDRERLKDFSKGIFKE